MKISILSILSILLFALYGSFISAQKRPNIIMIYADDMGWKDLSCTGSEYYETPNLDALAANGMNFTRAYSAAPVCSPSRGALLSGQSPARTKYTTVFSGTCSSNDSLYDISKQIGLHNQNLEAKHSHALGREAILIPERLKNVGYTTGFIGKWHCGVKDGYRPEQRGYDVASGYYRESDAISSEHYITSLEELVNLPNAKVGDWREDRLADFACKFIEDNKKNPFFLSYHSYLAHGPFIGKRELMDKYEKKTKTDQSNPQYATMVASLDESVGKIVAQLKQLGLLDNTLIVFSSDNGGCGGTSNYPLMGAKSFSYEGGYRVPFIAHWPQKIKAGSINKTRVCGVDLYLTFLEVAGLNIETEYAIDGVSLFREFTETKKLVKRPLFFHFPHYTQSTSPHSIIIDDDWKLIRYYNDAEGGFSLFNLKKDAEEQNDVAKVYPEKVKLLDKKLQDYLLSVDASFPIPADSKTGKELIERFHNGNIRGDINPLAQSKQPTNKATEYKTAMSKRRMAEQKLNK